MKILTQPKNFKTPSNKVGYNIVAISIGIPKQEVTNLPTFELEFQFYYNKENFGTNNVSLGFEIAPHSNSFFSAPKKITIPNVGDIDFIAGLTSFDKTKVYQVATLFAQNYGFILLPLMEQTDLNAM